MRYPAATEGSADDREGGVRIDLAQPAEEADVARSAGVAHRERYRIAVVVLTGLDLLDEGCHQESHNGSVLVLVAGGADRHVEAGLTRPVIDRDPIRRAIVEADQPLRPAASEACTYPPTASAVIAC